MILRPRAGWGGVAGPASALGGYQSPSGTRLAPSETAKEEAAKTRAQRARRSRLVQNVVTLSAFMLVYEAGREG